MLFERHREVLLPFFEPEAQLRQFLTPSSVYHEHALRATNNGALVFWRSCLQLLKHEGFILYRARLDGRAIFESQFSPISSSSVHQLGRGTRVPLM